jgi:hypothetical protein
VTAEVDVNKASRNPVTSPDLEETGSIRSAVPSRTNAVKAAATS